MNEYIPIGTLAVMIIGTLLKVNSDMQRRPTFSHLDNDYRRKDMCNQMHGELKEDLKEIKSDVKKLLFKNGVK